MQGPQSGVHQRVRRRNHPQRQQRRAHHAADERDRHRAIGIGAGRGAGITVSDIISSRIRTIIQVMWSVVPVIHSANRPPTMSAA
jgi:ribose 5-phosphate isomerase